MVHAGVLMKLGAFGIIRIGLQVLPDGAQDWMPVLVGLGTVNVIYGAISAMGQRDLKYVVGYSSMSHMGYVLMGIATLNSLGVSGAVLQMFSHGIMTALFFAVVGFIYDRTQTRDIAVLEGLAKRMGVTAAFFVVAGLTSLGLPGLSGFVAELLVFLGLFQTYPALGVVGIIGAAITAVYILRLLAKVFFGPLGERWRDQTDASKLEGFATAVLVGFVFLVGLFPFPFIRVIDRGVSDLLARFPGAG
jgi:NADH-quinone oxidoreductase subunit M